MAEHPLAEQRRDDYTATTEIGKRALHFIRCRVPVLQRYDRHSFQAAVGAAALLKSVIVEDARHGGRELAVVNFWIDHDEIRIEHLDGDALLGPYPRGDPRCC